jgi:hypothetical protein
LAFIIKEKVTKDINMQISTKPTSGKYGTAFSHKLIFYVEDKFNDISETINFL